MRQAKAWLHNESFGAPLPYQLAFGNYLPNWHPWERYQEFYDETQIMGVIAQSDEMLPPAAYTFEQACINEFGAFLDALDSRGEWYHPLRDGVQILRCLDAVKRSSASGDRIEIGN